MSEIIFRTKDLVKKFGNFVALKGVNLQVNKGEVFGFIGPNGAGKTTMIRVLLGILKATEGSAEIFGLDSWKDAVEIHKRLAYVPGDVNLWPNLSGGEVIDLFINLRGTNFDKKRRDELIERFDLDPSKKCRTYSKGNRQKVALIAAFASDAELFILDEPTSGLDPLMEQVFQACVAEIKAAGRSIFLSSHILSEVEKLCDRVAIIREGEIVEVGTMSQLRHLTRINMYIETIKEPLILASIKGVHGLIKKDTGITFQVDSDCIGEVIEQISKLGVTKFESTPPTLEDLFMRHYDTSK